ncbi:zinc finger protein 883-like [Culex pipiens pallens]|uniref:zinc finger protein 883-like n=1 Tax=Culex pipiens pallens TaxID=42434 RepID=UPI0019534035|nr:zinc finger protein 883-like [Culex pipiens pallens]XP_039438273.1 zinc finger protein 883-like [Culex pipiens pallens]XP_052563942.1 zinc finger protein 883-like [Culex pipiens pallens]
MQFDLVRDTTKLCRVCLMDSDGHRTDLYEVSDQLSLHEMLKAICATVFDKSDAEYPPGMPTTVCADCRNAVLAAFKLHQTCIDNERRLVELLALKWELQDLEIEEEFGDPLKSTNKELLSVEVENHAKTEGETHLLEEEQPKDEMEDSLSAGEHGNTIKVEELDLMDVDDNENGDIPETGEIVERSSGEDTNKTTCIICSKSFGNVVMLRKHMALEHQLHMCEFCPKSFRIRASFTRHRRQHLKKHPERGSSGSRKVYSCQYCEETFKVGMQLMRHKAAVHRNVKDPNQPFTCRLCAESYATATELMTHKKTHENPVNCSCGRRFKNDMRLQAHTASGTCSGDNDRRCNICNKVFKSVDFMLRHRNAVHSESVVCPECGQTMANLASMKVHLRIGYCSAQPPTKSVIAARTCKICGEEQKNRYAVKGHMIRAHPDRMLRCGMCSMEFRTQRYLDLHIQYHETKTFKCKICDETVNSKDALVKHRRIHRDPITCSVCDKKFASKHTLTTHMERHIGIKPFACDVCPMRFITKVEIQGHMATHTKQQDHVCDLCGSRFTKKYSLKVHIKRVHEGVRPFSCSQCSLKFTTADRLQRHMYTHTGEKPYTCELCPQAYAQTNDLVKHVARAHGDGNPYLCDLCDEGFKLMTDLRQHYRVHVQSTEGGTEKMEEVRFTSVAILKRVFAKAKQRM